MAIADYVIGAVIGLVLALIVVLVLQNTVFKGKNMALLYAIVFILFAVCGGFIQKSQFTKVEAASFVPTPQEQIKDVTDAIGDNWRNTNGGFTFEQIQKAQEDSECPFHDDQIINLTCYDFGSYIVFGFKDGSKYQNMLFYKSTDGLILDGIINKHIAIPGMKWFFAYDLNTFKWVDHQDHEPTYEKHHDWVWGDYDTLCSMSRQLPTFLEYSGYALTNKDETFKYCFSNIASLTGRNAASYFIKFGDVELIGTADTGYTKINGFYNYLYEQIKGEQYGTTKLIDGSHCLCLPIPYELQKNYPISASKKAEYDNKDYYGVYRCSIAVNVNFKQGSTSLTSTTKNEDYIDTLKNDKNYQDKVAVEKITSAVTYSKLNLSFDDSRQSDLSNVDLLQYPIKITFSCSDVSQNKEVLIDSISRLNSGVTLLLAKNVLWNYSIDSEKIIFDNYRGSFTIKSDETDMSMSYYYLNNYTIASVGLNPIGTINTDEIDLVNNPVKVILSNDDHTYQFLFENNSDLNVYKNLLVELGTYNYTILSKQLIFASVTGTLTITTTDKIMLFNYAIGVKDQLSFNISLTQNGTTNNKFYLSGDSNSVALIRDTLSSQKIYDVNCVIYDSDGRIMENFTHAHTSSGSCSDAWTASHLVVGNIYTLQLRFTDRYDSTKTYLSDITTFTFRSNYGYKVTYTARQNH